MKRTKINFEEELLKRGVPAEAAEEYGRDIDPRHFYIRKPKGSDVWRFEVLLCVKNEPSGVMRVCLEESEKLENIYEVLERWFCGIYGGHKVLNRFNSYCIYSWLLNEDEKKRFFHGVSLDDVMVVEAGMHWLVLYKSRGLMHSVAEEDECIDFYGMYNWGSEAHGEAKRIKREISLWKEEYGE